MNLRDRPIFVWALPVLMLWVSLFVIASDLGTVATHLRGELFDGYQRLQPRAYEDTMSHVGYSVRVLESDDSSLARFGPWPWPHATLARLSHDAKTQGAALIVFAFPLDIPDPLSPKRLLDAVPPGPTADAAREALSTMPSPDDALVTAMTELATVTGFVLGEQNAARHPRLKATIGFIGSKDPYGHVAQFATGAGAIAPVESMALGTGALNLLFEADGRLRRMPFVFRLKTTPVPSLPAEILRLVAHTRHFVVRSNDGENGLLSTQPGIASIKALSLDLPTAPDGSLWLYYSGKQNARGLSAAALDVNAPAASSLANAIVILGPPGETIATPVGMRSVADVYAEALEDALTGTALRRPASASEAELICLIIFGLACIALLLRYGIVWAVLFSGLSIAGAALVSWELFSVNKVLFDALDPGLGLALTCGAGALARGIEVRRARARVRAAFAESLPQAVIEQIARRPVLLSLDGVQRTVTYLACGVRGFGALADSFKDDPAAFTRLMERVLVPLMDVALARGGTVDRLQVDGFSAFWNAPLDDAEHAVHACEAANAMMEAIAKINDVITLERRNDGVAFAPVEVGVGVSTSQAVAGGFRSHGRTAYSVTGDCVVVANRIQELSAQYGPAVIVSEDSRKVAERGFAFLEVDYIAAGANDEPVKLYAMLGSPVMRASPKFRALLSFHDHIFQALRTQQWAKARDLIEQCRRLSGASQKLYDLHLARITYFEANPPGSEWDGAFRSILK